MSVMFARDTNAMGCESGGAAFHSLSWLYLAATPVFALMALLTLLVEAAPGDVLCGPGQGALSLTGMVPMYVLMSAFHAGPWIRLALGTDRADPSS
jgi:hypothetical protein